MTMTIDVDGNEKSQHCRHVPADIVEQYRNIGRHHGIHAAHSNDFRKNLKNLVLYYENRLRDPNGYPVHKFLGPECGLMLYWRHIIEPIDALFDTSETNRLGNAGRALLQGWCEGVREAWSEGPRRRRDRMNRHSRNRNN